MGELGASATGASHSEGLHATLCGSAHDLEHGDVDALPGARVGRYVVLSQLGAGAMGVVFAAYDPELDRKVALKLLRRIGSDPDAARTRLRREAQALAKLDHPNVVAVHDVGVHEEQLFVGMEFVEGQTLDEWLTEAERGRAVAEILRVFMEAGRGLAAAHAAGLIHRDFKPDNVMVGADGRVRVMDFGLARGAGELESTQPGPAAHTQQLLLSPLTQTGTLLGTPAYMSLEQLRGGSVDARSDQFGYCVALYEALYGERPFEAQTIAQLIDAVAHLRLRPAPKGAKVPVWMRRVVLRGLAPAPEERWSSMHELLTALADDPLARRRKRATTALLVGLVGAAAWGIVSAASAQAHVCEGMERHLDGVWDAERRAQVDAALASTELSYAAGTWAWVEAGLDAHAQGWVEAREQACEASRRGEQSDALLDRRMACLDEQLTHTRATIDLLAVADAKIVSRAVNMVAALPEPARCADLERFESELPRPEDPDVAREVAQLDEALIEVLALERTGSYASALEQVQPVVSRAEELGYEPLEVRAWLRQGSLLERMDEFETAEVVLERAYAAAAGLGMREETASISSLLVWVVGQGLVRHEAARWWAKVAEPAARAAGTPIARARYLDNLGMVKLSGGDYRAAARDLRDALTMWERARGPEHPDVAVCLCNLGLALRAQGSYAEARTYFARALAIQEQSLGASHPDTAITLDNLGATLQGEGDYERARGYHERALAVFEAAHGESHVKVAYALSNLGDVARRQGHYAQARSYLERAVAIEEQTVGLEHPNLAVSLVQLADVVKREGELAQAQRHEARALEIFEAALGPEHPYVAETLAHLGHTAQLGGQHEAARDHHARALALFEASQGPDDSALVEPLVGLAEALLGLGEPGEALVHLERATTLSSEQEGSSASRLALSFAHARALWEAPEAAGRDRARARTLAEGARRACMNAGSICDQQGPRLEEIDAWLEAHPAEQGAAALPPDP